MNCHSLASPATNTGNATDAINATTRNFLNILLKYFVNKTISHRTRYGHKNWNCLHGCRASVTLVSLPPPRYTQQNKLCTTSVWTYLLFSLGGVKANHLCKTYFPWAEIMPSATCGGTISYLSNSMVKLARPSVIERNVVI